MSTSGLSALTGGATSIIAARVSHFLRLRGTSLTLDSACSSSLVALHDALVICGWGCASWPSWRASTSRSRRRPRLLSDAGLLSPDRCRPFDAGANGYVRGEACGVVVLRRWSRP